MNDEINYLNVTDRSQMDEQRADDMMLDMAEERRREAAAGDILLHLQRMRNARIRVNRDPSQAHVAMGDYYRSMSRIVDLLDDFRIERWKVPEFVSQLWDAERRA